MSSHIQFVNPEHFPAPRGYNNGALCSGRTLYIAGQIGWDSDGKFPVEFAAQFAKALDNLIDVVAAAHGSATDVVKMTAFVTDMDAYRAAAKELGAVWRERFGRHYPAMALVAVSALVDPGALVEIEAIAVIAEENRP